MKEKHDSVAVAMLWPPRRRSPVLAAPSKCPPPQQWAGGTFKGAITTPLPPRHPPHPQYQLITTAFVRPTSSAKVRKVGRKKERERIKNSEK